ncbi:MAG: hypothetical protein JWP22_408 [Ramlibacter sp.]|nr:hypothetical protein [Ramlibacter sp.]
MKIAWITTLGAVAALCLSACGGGGSDAGALAASTPADVVPPALSPPPAAPAPVPEVPGPAGPVPNAQIEASSSYAIAAANANNSLLNWTQAPGFGDMWTARAVADLDGDGLPDAVVASGKFLEMNASKPLIILKGTTGPADMPLVIADPTWVAGVAPNMNHARKVLLTDFNGDGVKDIFVCAHGYDAPPFPGTTNALLLSGGGKWQLASQPWSSFVGFTHGCAAGDVRNTSRQDIFVANSQGAGSYWLVNDGAGNFTKTQEGVPLSIAKPAPLFTAELLDVDGDGFLDLVVGGVEGSSPGSQATVVFWGEGSGRFSDARSTTLPSVAGWPNVLVFAAADLDADGTRELVVMRTKGLAGDADFYKGYLAQVLKRTGRTFADVSSTWSSELNASAGTVIKDFAGAPTWVEWTWAADSDGDGKPDLVGSDAYGGAYWARNTGAKFLAWAKIR